MHACAWFNKEAWPSAWSCDSSGYQLTNSTHTLYSKVATTCLATPTDTPTAKGPLVYWMRSIICCVCMLRGESIHLPNHSCSIKCHPQQVNQKILPIQIVQADPYLKRHATCFQACYNCSCVLLKLQSEELQNQCLSIATNASWCQNLLILIWSTLKWTYNVWHKAKLIKNILWFSISSHSHGKQYKRNYG